MNERHESWAEVDVLSKGAARVTSCRFRKDSVLLIDRSSLNEIYTLRKFFECSCGPFERVYALTGRKRGILVAFTLLSVVQAALGLASIILGWNAPVFLIPLKPFYLCILNSPVTFIIRAIYTLFFLVYDTLLFLTLIRVSYSASVLASHFLVALFMILDPTRIRYFSSVGINPFTPTMVSRLVLSLRKTADRTANASERTSEDLSFGPNPELETRTRTQVELSIFSSRGLSFSSDTW